MRRPRRPRSVTAKKPTAKKTAKKSREADHGEEVDRHVADGQEGAGEEDGEEGNVG